MACPDVITGDRFLERAMAHIDCQAQSIGAYGYQSLADPGSPMAMVMMGLLTVFIALFGIRLMFGSTLSTRDVMEQIVKVGIVLTLAFSWPAYRTMVYDLVLVAPGDIAAGMTGDTVPASDGAFAARLQAADAAMVSLTVAGTGRDAGGYLDEAQQLRGFDAAVLEDETTLGWARLTFIVSVLGPLAAVRVLAGFLLALAPFMAGLLLFEATRGVFSGWLRALGLVLFSATGLSVLLASQLALIEPWLRDVLRLRGLGYATPSAPIELLGLNLTFAVASVGVLAVLGRMAFQRGWVSMPSLSSLHRARDAVAPSVARTQSSQTAALSISRAERVSDHLRSTVQREERLSISGQGRGGGAILSPANKAGATTASYEHATVRGRRDQVASARRAGLIGDRLK